MKKVVITGMGAATSIGCSVSEFWNGLLEGKCGMGQIKRISIEHHDTTVAAEIDPSFEEVASKYWKRRQLSATTAATRMGLASAGEAVEDCGIEQVEYDGKRIGIIFGVIDNSYDDAEFDKPTNITLKKMPSEIPAMVALKYGFSGPSFAVSTACASAAYAITLGKQLIENGTCDMVIAGGISGCVTHLLIQGFNQLLAMSVNPDPATASRPFTKNRDGFIMGEGAGTLVLESEEMAKSRGAKIYCELAGASICGEGFNMTAPQTDGIGMARSMNLALEDAKMQPSEIGYINAHGTSTGLNDLYETMAIKSVFGEEAKNIPVSSIKASIGHTLGAGGALEGIACIKAMETGVLPPTIHYDEADPELDLDYIPNVPREKQISAALSNSFGFGGHNSTLIFRKYQES